MHCRSAFDFLITNCATEPAAPSAWNGRHGIYCLGCCWALMCVLFVVGVMNLLWIAALSVLVLVERSGRAGALAARFRQSFLCSPVFCSYSELGHVLG